MIYAGSDWCYWCKKLEKEVLSDPLFVAGVMDDYVLVFIDSPGDVECGNVEMLPIPMPNTNWELATLTLATISFLLYLFPL